MVSRRRWAAAEIDIVKTRYDGTTEQTKRLADDLGRSVQAIHQAAHALGVTRQHEWTMREDDLLEKHYAQPGGVSVLERMLPKRTRRAIASRAYVLGITSDQTA